MVVEAKFLMIKVVAYAAVAVGANQSDACAGYRPTYLVMGIVRENGLEIQ